MGGWSDRWFVAWSDRWLASRTDRCLVGGWSDRWLVAWSLTAIVREVSEMVYHLKDRQVFALYDRWLVLCCLLVRQVVGCLCMVYGYGAYKFLYCTDASEVIGPWFSDGQTGGDRWVNRWLVGSLCSLICRRLFIVVTI